MKFKSLEHDLCPSYLNDIFQNLTQVHSRELGNTQTDVLAGAQLMEGPEDPALFSKSFLFCSTLSIQQGRFPRMEKASFQKFPEALPLSPCFAFSKR